MSRFERVSKYDESIEIPVRATTASAGYDLSAAQDTVIPSLLRQVLENFKVENTTLTFDELMRYVSEGYLRPTLVPTGIKVKLEKNEFFSISARSSLPYKALLIVANAPGIIDADYYNNPSNEGEIFVQILNLSPWSVKIPKGERIAQGIILNYQLTEDDHAEGERVGGFGSSTKEK